jgi:perosamine synthetase
MKIPYGKHYIDNDDIKAVVKCLKSSNLTQGPFVKQFENKVAKLVNSKYAVAVSSCTAGLHIALQAVNFKTGDNIVTSVISFVSTANVSQFLNGEVRFTDIDEQSIGISTQDLKNQINHKTKAIIPVHMAGAAYNMKMINVISKNKKIPIIEDCAHAFGGRYPDGSMVGSCKYSDMAVFSFHPVKTITTGEGGIITTNNKRLYQKLIMLRSHGINKLKTNFLNKKNAYTNKRINPWYYEMREIGYNYRITDIQSSLGISQLKKINKFMNERKKISYLYDKYFEKIPNIKVSQLDMRNFSSNHLYIIKVNFKKLNKTKEQFISYLRKKKIICQVHYIPIVLHPYYAKKGFKLRNFPNAKKYYEECVSIPCYYGLTMSNQIFVIESIKNFFKKKKN